MVSDDNLVLEGIASDSLTDPLDHSRTLDKVQHNRGRRLIERRAQMVFPLLPKPGTIHCLTSEAENEGGHADSLYGRVASRKLEPKAEGSGHCVT